MIEHIGQLKEKDMLRYVKIWGANLCSKGFKKGTEIRTINTCRYLEPKHYSRTIHTHHRN